MKKILIFLTLIISFFVTPAYAFTPSIVQGVSLSNVTDKSITVSWSRNSVIDDVYGYNVYLQGSKVGSVGSTASVFTVDNLTPATDYQLRVSAISSDSESSLSAPLSVRTLRPLPTAPIGLSIKAATDGVNVFWLLNSPSENVTGYKVYLNGSEVATLSDTNKFKFTNLVSGDTYQITVTAFNDAGESTQTNSISYFVDKPAVPQSLMLVNSSDITARIAWEPVKNITAYKVTVTDQVYGSFAVYDTASTVYDLTGLTADKSYTIAVQSVDSYGQSSNLSNLVTLKTLAASNGSTTPDKLLSSVWDFIASQSGAFTVLLGVGLAVSILGFVLNLMPSIKRRT